MLHKFNLLDLEYFGSSQGSGQLEYKLLGSWLHHTGDPMKQFQTVSNSAGQAIDTQVDLLNHPAMIRILTFINGLKIHNIKIW